jgi:hypothetical protein
MLAHGCGPSLHPCSAPLCAPRSQVAAQLRAAMMDAAGEATTAAGMKPGEQRMGR